MIPAVILHVLDPWLEVSKHAVVARQDAAFVFPAIRGHERAADNFLSRWAALRLDRLYCSTSKINTLSRVAIAALHGLR
jgi:hypothetical protein